MNALKDIKLYTTQSHPCSYLPGQVARTLFIDPELAVSTRVHTQLSELGFRRSGAHIYRPHCDNCQSCIACRVLVDSFVPNRRFRRIQRRNADLSVSRSETIAGSEYFDLYARYINTRHRDGDMYPATREQYDSFLGITCESTRYFTIRDQHEKLLGVIICDHLDNALSAVYTFYDPEQPGRSLGNFAILWQIAQARHLNLPYLYLGYWIRDCAKMKYKSEFRPLQMLINSRWMLVN
ncbi:MAG: arginyltransferase [Pseudohongiellaceae bacterium]